MLLQVSILYALKPETVFVLALQLLLAKSSFISSRGLLLLEWHGNVDQHLGFALVLLEEKV